MFCVQVWQASKHHQILCYCKESHWKAIHCDKYIQEALLCSSVDYPELEDVKCVVNVIFLMDITGLSKSMGQCSLS